MHETDVKVSRWNNDRWKSLVFATMIEYRLSKRRWNAFPMQSNWTVNNWLHFTFATNDVYIQRSGFAYCQSFLSAYAYTYVFHETPGTFILYRVKRTNRIVQITRRATDNASGRGRINLICCKSLDDGINPRSITCEIISRIKSLECAYFYQRKIRFFSYYIIRNYFFFFFFFYRNTFFFFFF